MQCEQTTNTIKQQLQQQHEQKQHDAHKPLDIIFNIFKSLALFLGGPAPRLRFESSNWAARLWTSVTITMALSNSTTHCAWQAGGRAIVRRHAGKPTLWQITAGPNHFDEALTHWRNDKILLWHGAPVSNVSHARPSPMLLAYSIINQSVISDQWNND